LSDLETVAQLLLPRGTDGEGAVAADSWQALLASAPAAPGGAVPRVPAPQVRGREPAPSGTAVLPLVGYAARRELVLARLRNRPPAGYTRARVLRTRPPVMGVGPLGAARARLAGGAAVLLAAGPPAVSVLDEVLAAAGIDAHHDIRPGSGGVLLVRGRRGGRPVLLRVGPASAVTQASVDALRTLAGSRLVPDLVAHGSAAGLRWTLEGLLPGRRPGPVRAGVWREAAAFAAAMPAAAMPAAAMPAAAMPAGAMPAGAMPAGAGGPVPPAVDVVARALPAHAAELTEVSDRALDRVGGLPHVAVHGDFWPGNLLVSRGHLTGVVDWDAFRASGPAGVDLLHLVATQERRRRGQQLGPQVLCRPWSQPRFTSVAGPYWKAVGADPGPGELDALGVLWWLDQVAGTLTRRPAMARDGRWVDVNVTGVLRGILGTWWTRGAACA
jgi:hypothetical protein